ncbi:MAG: [FeFe] hydrogenase H-cluster radical SAM maturase HydE [Rikenellaceae bacterium]|nr:[FeFe] hydrogenase H-cluster radical SAM maturase HydE [Rikenellaceae bacterium]
MKNFKDILNSNSFDRDDIVRMLSAQGEEYSILMAESASVSEEVFGKKIWFRGLIEFSNICVKDCFYCGIRRSNRNINRYSLTDGEILSAARFAHENGYGSVVLQGGEIRTKRFADRITSLVRSIKQMSDGRLGITLSLGEQDKEIYREWFDAGAHRYLLRVETSNPGLYSVIHPHDCLHRFDKRVDCLNHLKEIGYQTGTGVMIGLPGQTVEDLADDILFFKRVDVDMVGMGPYIEHSDTPLYGRRSILLTLGERFTPPLK